MTGTTFAEFPTHRLMDITARPDLVFVEGRGSWLTDHAGKHYLDFVQGWAVNCFGLGVSISSAPRPALKRSS